MSPIVAGKHRRKVRFPSSSSTNQPPPTQSPKSTNQKRSGLVRQTKSPTSAETMASQAARPGVPDLFTQPPPIRDPLVTETTDLQDTTLVKCLPFLKGVQNSQSGPFNACGVPALQRDDHVAFAYDSLEDYPSSFVILDASRPWMAYWGITSLFLMGEDPTRFRERWVLTVPAPFFDYPILAFGGIFFLLSRRLPARIAYHRHDIEKEKLNYSSLRLV